MIRLDNGSRLRPIKTSCVISTDRKPGVKKFVSFLEGRQLDSTPLRQCNSSFIRLMIYVADPYSTPIIPFSCIAFVQRTNCISNSLGDLVSCSGWNRGLPASRLIASRGRSQKRNRGRAQLNAKSQSEINQLCGDETLNSEHLITESRWPFRSRLQRWGSAANPFAITLDPDMDRIRYDYWKILPKIVTFSWSNTNLPRSLLRRWFEKILATYDIRRKLYLRRSAESQNVLYCIYGSTSWSTPGVWANKTSWRQACGSKKNARSWRTVCYVQRCFLVDASNSATKLEKYLQIADDVIIKLATGRKRYCLINTGRSANSYAFPWLKRRKEFLPGSIMCALYYYQTWDR